MEVQQFRLSGATEVHEVPCSHLEDQIVIFWEDIEEVFAQVKRIKHGINVVTTLRNSEGEK